jgi:polyisoprenoid-binding protein YceI
LRISSSCIEAAILLIAPLLSAKATTIELDPSKTKITFTLVDALHTVRGTFRLKQGRIQFDAAAETISGEVIVDAATGNSGSAARDGRMRKNVLESQRYPEIRFTPESLRGSVSSANSSSVSVTGMFEIHGQRHELTIPMQVRVDGENVAARGEFAVPYVAWGMKDPSTFLLRVDKKVTIGIVAMGRLTGLQVRGPFRGTRSSTTMKPTVVGTGCVLVQHSVQFACLLWPGD